jgi:hypothetical protein
VQVANVSVVPRNRQLQLEFDGERKRFARRIFVSISAALLLALNTRRLWASTCRHASDIAVLERAVQTLRVQLEESAKVLRDNRCLHGLCDCTQ